MLARWPRACAPHGICLQGIVALAGARPLSKEFEVRAKVAREAPFDRNVENKQWFRRIQLERAGKFSECVDEEVLCFHRLH